MGQAAAVEDARFLVDQFTGLFYSDLQGLPIVRSLRRRAVIDAIVAPSIFRCYTAPV